MTSNEANKYILAEEGCYEDDDIMNEGCAAIDIEEMNGYEFNENSPRTKKVSSDPEFGDYETPDDVKARGGENYHINKQKTKPHSPKSERRKLREKRVKDIRTNESRCHKRAVKDF
uniref:Uncharacterized protein n=1 Tax=viral metagenome TaxID=1070528 RepID=A0A6C0BWB1_9ZZZZ